MEPILATKLHIPHLKPESVSRPRLLRQLDAGQYHRLILVSAPAGFGKTTLVNEWVRQCDLPVAWLSLDAGDNNPNRFVAYILASLQTVVTGFSQHLMDSLTSGQMPSETLLTNVVNAISEQFEQLILVIDDYHVIEESDVDDILVYLIEHLPVHMHLVVTTRIDPQIPIARLRAQGLLTELRATELRFSLSESAQFLNHVMKLNIAEEEVATLESRTEGWIAGLQLVAISLKGRENTSELIASFSGSHRFVLDYLIEEVLHQQSDEIQLFLLQTAVLNHLTASLCDALTEQANGQDTLEILEHSNLFIMPLDEERHWYRYHHLFRELLYQQLRHYYPDQIAILHLKASIWYEQHGSIEASIDHALNAQNYERACGLIEQIGMARWTLGEDQQLGRWLTLLPAPVIDSHPKLSIFYAWYLLSKGQIDTADRFIESAEMAIEASNVNVSDIAGRVAATRAFAAFYRGDTVAIIQNAQTALLLLEPDDRAWFSVALHILGDGYDLDGNMNEAYKARRDVVENLNDSVNLYQGLVANLKLAVVLRYQGQLPHVIEVCEQQMKSATAGGLTHSGVCGWLLAIWGETLAETNNLDSALEKAQAGVELLERGGDQAMLAWSYICLIRVLFSSEQFDQPQQIINRIENIARESYFPPWMLHHVTAWQVRLWLATGNIELASQWAEEYYQTSSETLSYVTEAKDIVLARTWIAQGNCAMATRLLQRLFANAEAGGRTSRMIEIRLLQALALYEVDYTSSALKRIQHAIELAEFGGFVRIFVDEGRHILPLLHEAFRAKLSPEYTGQILAAFANKESVLTTSQVASTDGVDLLSERELEVLRLIAQGYTNQQAANELFLTRNTIKVHTRNIYDKLGVHSRTEAVAKARTLGLLS